jgi:prepilin-type N-terminal cleavage/methylation domain-containing protein
MNTFRDRLASDRGMTLIELMVTTLVLGAVLMVVTGILLSTGRLESRTVRRAGVQASSRQALMLMATEIRQAGADPSSPPIGVVGVVSADSHRVRVRADLNGDGAIQTAEPSEDVTYAYDAASGVLTRDPGTGPSAVLTDVTSLRMSYFDAAGQPITPLPLSTADAARVAAVGLVVTAEGRDTHPVSVTTRITLRNR